VQGVGVTSERAFLDQIAVEGGEVEVWMGILGVDVDLVAAPCTSTPAKPPKG